MKSYNPIPNLCTHFCVIPKDIVKIKFQLINIQRHNKTQRKSSLNNFVNCLMTCNRKKQWKKNERKSNSKRVENNKTPVHTNTGHREILCGTVIPPTVWNITTR